MKASEAREISNEKAITLKDILNGIKSNAEYGDTCHFTPPNRQITTEIIGQLMSLGYSIKEHTDPINGFKMYIIS